LSKYGVVAQHPDDFILALLERDPEGVIAAAREQRRSLKRPPLSVEAYLESLSRQQIPKSAERLRAFADVL
jgi:hypothetical protein